MTTLTELRELIRSQYGTESAFAKRLGMTKQALSRYLNGQTRPSIGVISQMVEATGLSAETLIHIFLASWSPNGCRS